ncbi:MAG: LamG-like jellyroll fold domain-containing protein [Candidatus Hodarchaeota archaeon]
MKLKVKGIKKLLILGLLLIILQLASLLKFPKFIENDRGDVNFDTINKENEIYNITSIKDDVHLKESKIIFHNHKYNLTDWWNNTFRYRIGFTLENIDSFNRYQPFTIDLTFQENEHYEGTERLLSYNNTGNNEWSDLIPVQLWNIEKYQSTDYIKSCLITFITNITAYSNRTYFLYFNDDNNNIIDLKYDTDFSSKLSNGKLNVTVGLSGSEFQAIFEEGKGMSELKRNNLNFHSENSLTPERQLTHPSIELLAHCDEGKGSKVNDSSGNNLQGDLMGDTSWTEGIMSNGIEFDGDGDYITFNDVLNNPFGSTSNAFTISTWIKPKGYSFLKSSHETMNCFIAKASKPYNDNFELGIYKVNKTHGLLNVFIDTAGFHNQSIYGDISNPILINKWNFIAVRYSNGDVDVRINDIWYSSDVNNSEPWKGANYLDQASGSYFTLGATINDDIYFNGTIDEIAIYNIALSDAEVEKGKFTFSGSSIESIIEIENGEVFSRYQVKWSDIYDMHIEDIITFYSDYNLWNINRTIYFDNSFDQDKALMTALNSYYNFSTVPDHQKCKYIYDGIVNDDITIANFIAENYTIIYCAPDPSNNTIGVFIERYNVTNSFQSSISFLKGNVTYSNYLVQFNPGSISDFNNSEGGIDFKLFISFWEYIDSVNQTGSLDNAGISQYFNSIYYSLKNPINVHIFNQNYLKHDLEVYVEDIDEIPVNNAIVSIYNLTDEGKIDTLIATQKTNANGKTLFNKLLNGTYTLNITYTNYNYPAFQIIPKPVNITIKDSATDNNNVIHYNFYNVSLTKLKLTLQRVDPLTHDIKESVINANISFWINDGSGDKYIGYELTDGLGKAEFYWLNFTSPTNGNVTFSVTWYDTLQKISAEGDLRGSNNKKITLPYYKENTKIVNVSSYEFSCALVEYIPGILKMGTEIIFRVNYTYTINYTNPKPINNSVVRGYIEKGGVNISSNLLEFSEPGLNGTYEIKINTSNPADPAIEFEPDSIYKIKIYAFKGGFIPKATEISFQLTIPSTELTFDKEILEVYWKNNLTLNVYYEDALTDPRVPINGAIINYSIVDLPNINGTLQSNGTDGWYILQLNSSIFVAGNNYTLKIIASKNYYETNIKLINFTILIRPTLINGTSQLGTIQKDLYYFQAYNFSFSYVDNLTKTDIINPDNKSYTWKMFDDNDIEIDNGQGALILGKNNFFILDFDTESRIVGRYEINITLYKKEYELKKALINLTIYASKPTLINGTSDLGMIHKEIYAFQAFNFSFSYVDVLTGTNITNPDIKSYTWKMFDDNDIEIDNGQGILILGKDNLFILDFDTETRDAGRYELNVTLYKIEYDPKNASINLILLKRPTLINDKEEFNPATYHIYHGDAINFTFSYKDNLTKEKIIDIENISYYWQIYDLNGNIIRKGQEDLILSKTNEYILDFNTEDRDFDINIQFFLNFSKKSYEPKFVEMNLNIHKRGLYPELGSDFIDREVSIEKGNTLKINLYLKDPTKNYELVSGASIKIEFNGESDYFEETEYGHYVYKFNSDEYDTLILPEEIICKLYVSKKGYVTEYLEITVIVKREEILPGIPTIYFIGVVVVISTISGIIISFLFLKKKKGLLTSIKNFMLKKKNQSHK